MTTPSYITAQDLADGLGMSVFLAIFDDAVPRVNNFATVSAQSNVQSVLRRSLTQVTSFLPTMYKKFPPESGAAGIPTGGDSIPTFLKDAQLQIAMIYAYDRHPEYVKQFGSNSPRFDQWLALMQRLQSGTQEINPNDSPPQTTADNVGGFSQADGSRIAMSNTDLSSNMGDF